MITMEQKAEAEEAIRADVFNPAESDLEYAGRRARELGVNKAREDARPTIEAGQRAAVAAWNEAFPPAAVELLWPVRLEEARDLADLAVAFSRPDISAQFKEAFGL